MFNTATFLEQCEKDLQTMQEEIPADTRGFGDRLQSVMSEGAMTPREMALIALGIGLAVRCKPCINHHIEKRLEVDGTLAQILNAAGVAVVVQGGGRRLRMSNRTTRPVSGWPRVIEFRRTQSSSAAMSAN